MKPPTTYAEWATLLTELKSIPLDDDYLSAIYQGKLEFLPGVAERFTTRLTETVNTRLERISTNFNQSIHRTSSDERALVTALRNTQKEFKALIQIVKMPILPEKFQEIYIHSIRDEAKKIQSSLENSAKSDRTGKLSAIIRQYKIHV
jgi:hypothetical protein